MLGWERPSGRVVRKIPVSAALPPYSRLDEPEVRAAVRELRGTQRRLLAVLDDDPTGSQSVRGVQVVTVFDPAEYRAAFEADDVCFILTNTRSLAEDDAVVLDRAIVRDLLRLAASLGRPIDIVTRSDSTLRGHVVAEVAAVQAELAAESGAGADGVLFAPAFFEAGRITSGDIHYLRTAAGDVPAAESEFARDASFGYRASDLRAFLVEKSGGRLSADDILSISLDDVRAGGVEGVASRLAEVRGGRYVVVNGETDADYDVVALGALRAIATGSRLQFRTGPSFVRALAGIEPGEPLPAELLWPAGRRQGHGVIGVGSHVAQTNGQLDALRRLGGLVEFVIDVPRVIAAGDEERTAYVDELGRQAAAALADADVLVYTSRALRTGDGPDASLAIARLVSDTLGRVIGRMVEVAPAWVIAKGGITSHELAVGSLGMRRARVVGQLGRGIISVFEPLSARPEVVGMPYVVFAGNVGDDGSLADAVLRLRGKERS